jgi:hypothetical protein
MNTPNPSKEQAPEGIGECSREPPPYLMPKRLEEIYRTDPDAFQWITAMEERRKLQVAEWEHHMSHRNAEHVVDFLDEAVEEAQQWLQEAVLFERQAVGTAEANARDACVAQVMRWAMGTITVVHYYANMTATAADAMKQVALEGAASIEEARARANVIAGETIGGAWRDAAIAARVHVCDLMRQTVAATI